LVWLKYFLKIELKADEVKKNFDIEKIFKRGKIIAILDKNSIDYYVYKGRPMGFQLEMLRKFSEYIHLPLEIIAEGKYSNAIELLNTARCDIIASNFTILKERRKHFTFTHPIFVTKQILIQQKRNTSDSLFIKSVLDLRGKTISVKTNSSFHSRLINLSDEIGDTIFIDNSPEYTCEELIKKVSEGDILYTIANEQLARRNATYYSNIDISMPVSLEQQTAWIIRNNTPFLEIIINAWLKKFVNSEFFKAIYYKYYESDKQNEIFKSEYTSINGNKISDYDETIKKYSAVIDWDWRLLASLIYQESKFNHDTVSRRGAFGLMQMMPLTAQKFDVDSSSTPEDNIRGGCMYIKWLDNQLKDRVKNPDERIKFVLAAYNVGLGHIFDAQALAKKHGKKYEVWDNNVEYYLLNKSKPQFINDTLVRNGSIKGKETCALVRKVMERFHHYKNLVKE